MPFQFPDDPDINAQSSICTACRAAGKACLEDRRVNRVTGRATEFQLIQSRMMDCALDSFVPGTDGDPDPTRSFKSYREQAENNALRAGDILWPGEFRLSPQQRAKVDGDIYEIMVAAALWNAAATWNVFMDTGEWRSGVFRQPDAAVPTPARKVAIVKMARGADTTQLLNPSARAEYQAFEAALEGRGLELKLSTPDILGLRMPDPMPPGFEVFLEPLPDLTKLNQDALETAWRTLRNALEGRHFLFAIAVKTSTRSDRLYQALFEANALKYILGYVLRGPAIRFHAHLESFAGADVVGRYRAASMTSLLAGGVPSKAIDSLYSATHPVATAQMILDELPTYPL